MTGEGWEWELATESSTVSGSWNGVYLPQFLAGGRRSNTYPILLTLRTLWEDNFMFEDRQCCSSLPQGYQTQAAFFSSSKFQGVQDPKSCCSIVEKTQAVQRSTRFARLGTVRVVCAVRDLAATRI